MSKFSVGEIAVGQNFTGSTELNGEDLIVVSGYREYICGRVNGVIVSRNSVFMGYGVRRPDGEITYVESKKLKKKKPPEEEVGWQQIQEIIGWNPTEKVEA